MRKLLLSALFLSGALFSPASAQTDFSHAARVDVALSSFDFRPSTIRLRAGQPVTLHLSNTSGGGHNFAAAQFFAAAHLAPGMAARVRRGAVEVRGHQSVDVTLVPAAGRYRLRCTHTLHSTFGMNGEIVVE
jgi:plastocyanin